MFNSTFTFPLIFALAPFGTSLFSVLSVVDVVVVVAFFFVHVHIIKIQETIHSWIIKCKKNIPALCTKGTTERKKKNICGSELNKKKTQIHTYTVKEEE